MTIPRETFDNAYENGTAPWVIGEPQPAIIDLERKGRIRGTVLDPGCGSGDNAIHLAEHGHDVLGIDFSPAAVERARANAVARNAHLRFEVADALDLGSEPRFDTIVDSALFHVFDREAQLAYARGLHAICRPGGLVHVLALSDTGPGFGPEISDTAIREAFGAGWELEELALDRYVGIVDASRAPDIGIPNGERIESPAWLATARRL
ncbi:class I SAM-dependent methyltransferase [Parasphingorhabdus pacifica]